MDWVRIVFEHSLVHAMPASFTEALIAEMAGRGCPVALDPALPGRPDIKLIKEWGFDLGGSCVIGTPYIHLELDGLDVAVPCDMLDEICNRLRALPVRVFATGAEYVKAKFWIHATVMTPAQCDHLVLQAARESGRANRLVAEFTAYLKRRNRNR